jgi:hypothetical protein
MTFTESLAHLLKGEVMRRYENDTEYRFWFNKETRTGMCEYHAGKFASMWYISIEDILDESWDFANQEDKERILSKYSDASKYILGSGITKR